MYTLVLVMLGSLAASVNSIAYKDCPPSQGVSGHATSVELSPCSSEPCNFNRGDTVNVKFTFTAGNDSDTLHSSLYGILAGTPVLFPGFPYPNACINSTIVCPIKKGQTYTYTSSFIVHNNYPVITVVVMWKLEGATSNEVCFTFPMSISDPSEIVG